MARLRRNLYRLTRRLVGPAGRPGAARGLRGVLNPLSAASVAAHYGIRYMYKSWTKKHGQSIKKVFGSEAATSSGAPHEPMSGRQGHKRKQDNPRRSSGKRQKVKPPTRRNIHDAASRAPSSDPYSRDATRPAPPKRMSVHFLRPRRLAAKRKAVSLPKMSSQYRFQHHENRTYSGTVHKALWFGGSSLGSGDDAAKVIADAMICHYLRRLSDSRSSRTVGITENSALWHNMDITFGNVGENPKSSIGFETDIHADATKGLTLTNQSIDAMVAILALKLEKMYLNTGMVPIRVSIRKNDYYNDGNNAELVTLPNGNNAYMLSGRQIVDDTDAYRNQFSLSISGLFKIHNVTLPPDGETDKHAINAQPVDGKLYNFRNRVPIFHPSYLAALDAGAPAITGVSDMVQGVGSATGATMAPYETGIHHAALVNVSITNPVELEAPPLRPSVIFKNSTSSEKVYMAPGAMKFRKTYFSMTGSMMSIFKRIYPTAFNVQEAGGSATRVPPGGESFLMCLKPSLKVSNTEVVTIDTDTSFVFKAHCKKAKMLLLPTKQVLE